MKYKYNNQWKDLTVKAGDTLPIGTIVTYDGDTVPSGYEEVNSYSTTEVKTGDTWIDGKPIYRKVITAQMATAGGTTTINLANYGINASNVKRYEIYANSSTDSVIMTVNPLWTTMTGAIQCRCLLYYGGGSSELRLVNASGVNLSSYTATVILEYTKATD